MLALVLAAAIATMPRTFECEGWAASAGASTDGLVPLTSTEFTARYASLPRTPFGAFGAPYDIEALDVFARIETPESSDDEFRHDLARVAIAVRRHNRTSYYRLVDEKGNDLDAEDEAPPEREGRPRLDVRFGTPDRRLPIIRISVATSYRGAHSGGVETTAVFIDAGFGRAKIIGETNCGEGWMGGACTAYDAFHADKFKTNCSWNDAARDYECEVDRELDAEWTKRHAVMHVNMFAHRESPPRGALASLQQLADEARAGRASQEPLLVAGVGVLRPAGMLADRWRLFVTPGESLQETARIYAVDLTASAAAELIPVQIMRAQPEEENGTTNDEEEPDLTPVDRDFTVGVRNVAREQSLQVVSLLLTENGHRALFWIGGNAESGDLDALRLASDAPEYRQCNRFDVPESAWSITIRKPFAATLRIEPGWTWYNDAAEANDQVEYCARTARVTWSDSFDVDDTVAECTSGLPARRVVIGAGGELSTAALPVDQSR